MINIVQRMLTFTFKTREYMQEKMKEYRSNGIFGIDKIQMQVVDEKQEIYLEWVSLIGTQPGNIMPRAMLQCTISAGAPYA